MCPLFQRLFIFLEKKPYFQNFENCSHWVEAGAADALFPLFYFLVQFWANYSTVFLFKLIQGKFFVYKIEK